MKKVSLFLFVVTITLLRADISDKDNSSLLPASLLYNEQQYLDTFPIECTEILNSFAQYASNFSLCSILHARPIRLCENCIDQYMQFHNKYQELWTKVVNGTSCRSIYMSHDRLNVVMKFHDSISDVWNQGNCNTCYSWNGTTPTLKNETIKFNDIFNNTMNCILNNMDPDNDRNVCIQCLDEYIKLDTFYKTLSTDTIGVDSICVDIVDSMNATRSIWSKDLKCCSLRRSPEIVFLCCTGIMSCLPIIFYLVVRFCGPIRDLPNVLKQSRFKQSFLRTAEAIND